MYLVKDQTVQEIDVFDAIVVTGFVKDQRIEKLEQLVASVFDIKPGSFKTWYKTTDAKLVLFYMLYNSLGYSFSEIAREYSVFHGFVKVSISGLVQERIKKSILGEKINALVKACEDNADVLADVKCSD